MGTSIFLAKILGPYCLIMAGGALLNRGFYQKIVDDFLKNAALVYLGGVFALLFGLFIVAVHNIWDSNWPVVITLIGWLSILKGARIILFPNSLAAMVEFHKTNPKILAIRLFSVLAIGLSLTYFGYFA
jgi:hypothetical protein